MRKLSCLVLLISGLAFGCGDSDSEKETDNNNVGGDGGLTIPDAGSMGGGEGPFPECPRDDIPPMFDKYMGPLTMTQAGYMACTMECGQDQDCFDRCPGSKEFLECANTNWIGCTAKAGGKCRTEYENFVCCTAEFQCGPEDQACVDTNCGGEIAELRECLQADMICLQQAGAGCFAPAAAPAMSATLSESSSNFSAESLSILLQNMNIAR